MPAPPRQGRRGGGRGGVTLAVLAALLAWPGALRADKPLSAIDWLSESVALPAGVPPAATATPPRAGPGATGSGTGTGSGTVIGAGRGQRAGVTQGQPAGRPKGGAAAGLPGRIVTQSLDAPRADAAGLLSTTATGLPRDLWGRTPEADLARLLRAERVDTLPAVQALLYTLLLAEVAPPVDADGHGALFLARIDKLLDLGALDQAAALLDIAGTSDPDRFRRAFDVALLLGTEDLMCRNMLDQPGIAPTLTARIFCLARGGDWNAAALTLRTAEALGQITTDENALLARFLDPDLFEGDPPLTPPERPTPLTWRMLEALGEPIATATLPVAFAHADLRSNTGWKGQIEAAERLVRTGAIPPGRLMALYLQSAPSASGGVWDRVRAMQALDAAVRANDATATATALPDAWTAAVEMEIEVALADVYGARLAGLQMPGAAGLLATQIGLLSPDYEKVAQAMVPANGLQRFAQGVARGTVIGLAPQDSMTRAIAAGFSDATLAAPLQEVAARGRLGEALLGAIDGVTNGARGDLVNLSQGLAFLRAVGLETSARRIALELMFLERRG